MAKPKVGILTTFSNFNPSYSLASVVRDQLAMHVRAGYEPVLFTLECFTDEVMDGVEVRAIVPQLQLERYQGFNVPADHEQDVRKVKTALKKHAKDIEILITHDIVFIDTYLPYNLGLRQAELACRQLHWVHSAPSQRPEIVNNLHANRYTLPPNSKLVYLNNDKKLALAESYGAYLKDVRVVHNSRDPRTFWDMSPETCRIIDETELFSADIVSVYPVSSTRMVDGKQIDTVIRIHQCLRQLGYETRLIVPNAHANGKAEKREVEYRHHDGVYFTSMLGEEYEQGVDQRVVSELFRLSNVFIFPSISENCSLVLLEAMLAGNLLVLNSDCSGLPEFAGTSALYFKFGSVENGQRRYENALSVPKYTEDIAKIIASEFDRNPALQAKRRALQRHNLGVVFSQIERIYYEYNPDKKIPESVGDGG